MFIAARRSTVVLALVVGLVGCSSGDTLAPGGGAMSAPQASSALTAPGATYSYTMGSTATYSVTGPFEDVINFTVATAGTHTASVVGQTQIIACSGRYCMSPGTLKATISSARIQTAAGVAVATLAGTTAVTLSPGDYQLVVDGAGVGTKKYLNRGNYTVTIRPPAVPVVPSCDYIRDLLQSQGYTEAQVEARVAAMQAAQPRQCTGD